MGETAQGLVILVLGIGCVLWVRRNLTRVGKAGAEKLARFGLHLSSTSGGGSTFTGQYRGVECGYRWGRNGRLLNRTQTYRYGSFTAGSEFFAKVGRRIPLLAVVQRDDRAWMKFQGGVVPTTEQPTGDPAFDQRFSVRCEDPSWAAAVLTPELRLQLLSLPLVFLASIDDEVVAALYFDGNRLFDDLGVSMNEGWGLMNRADVFLDGAAALATATRVALDTRDVSEPVSTKSWTSSIATS